MNFTVGGQPVPQPRPRVSTRGGFARAYVPAKHPIHAYRQAVATAAKIACPHPTDDPVSVIVQFTFERPKSHMNKSGVKKTAPALPKCDSDNLLKGILDAMNGIVWYDDAQVVDPHPYKIYGPVAKTDIAIMPAVIRSDWFAIMQKLLLQMQIVDEA